MTAKNELEVTPEGVSLRDPEDFGTLRSSIFSSVKDAFASKFPHSYGGVRMEVENLDYEKPKDYDFKEQKDSLLKNRFLSWRLRGDLKLYDEKTNELLDSKKTTLMRVPYLTERGTTIHNGNEYVTLTQARLLPGVYTRRRTTGEIESHFNPRRSSGRSFRVRLEPETQLYKLDVGQASLRLYSLLSDMGVSDEELEARWGKEILQANRDAYDSKVFDKAFSRFAPKADAGMTKDEKIKTIKEALSLTKFDNKVVSETLPNLGNRKIASTWLVKAAMQMPNFQNAIPEDPYSQLGSGNPELANQPIAQTQEEYIKFEEQKQKEKQKEEDKAMKVRMQIDALRGKMPEPGPDRDAVEKELVSGQLGIRKALQQAQTKRITQAVKNDTKQRAMQVKQETDSELKEQQDQIDMQTQEQLQQQKLEDERMNHEKKKQQIVHQQQLKQEAEQRKMQMQEELQSMKMQGDPMLAKMASIIPGLLEAKEYSDKGQYPPKHNIMRKLIEAQPNSFKFTEAEGTTKGMRGIEHIDSGFRMHLPSDLFGSLPIGGPNGIGRFNQNPEKEVKFPETDWSSIEKDTVMYKESARKNVRILSNGQMLDVDKLNKMVEGREYTDVPIETVAGHGSRSKRDRYGPMRYERADIEKPGIIDERGYIIDGRHRYFKSKDMGKQSQKFIRVTDDEIRKSYVDGTYGDYEAAKKVKF